MKMKVPMMDAREFLMMRTIKKLNDGAHLQLFQSVLDDEFPIKDGTIRGDFFKC